MRVGSLIERETRGQRQLAGDPSRAKSLQRPRGGGKIKGDDGNQQQGRKRRGSGGEEMHSEHAEAGKAAEQCAVEGKEHPRWGQHEGGDAPERNDECKQDSRSAPWLCFVRKNTFRPHAC